MTATDKLGFSGDSKRVYLFIDSKNFDNKGRVCYCMTPK